MTQEKQAVLVPDYLTVRQLAELIDASPIEVMKRLIANGIMASINQQVDYDTAAIVIEELGFDAQSESAVQQEQEKEERAATAQTWRQMYREEKREDLKARSPIVTILGHVDHGKTTLLDTIRKTHVADGEAGGITQGIGAYRAYHNGQQITFLDTPGHEAFTAMRARGAQGADIAILVVAADDGVMPTTREALNHARVANVPIVVAITKVDRRNANIERVKQQLSELDLVPDDWDGDTLMVPVSGLTGDGIEDLLEAILLVAEDNDIVANPAGDPAGVVIEAQVEKNRGVVATLLVLNGTLKLGDTLIAGNAYGRIKAMFDEKGTPVKQSEPSMPVSVLGLNEVPEPGDQFEAVKSEKAARSIVAERLDDAAEDAESGGGVSFSLEDLFSQVQQGGAKELNLILKVDVQGTLQPIMDTLDQMSENNSEGIKVRLLATDVGNISESDVMLAATSGAILIGFNVEVDTAARRSAEAQHVDIRKYDIIYKLFEDIELALEGMLEPVYEDRKIGTAEVRQVIRISKVGNIAGSYILDGEARRNSKVRVKRGGAVIFESGTVNALKRFNEDVREVRTGFECGISINGFTEFAEGDIVEFFVTERVN